MQIQETPVGTKIIGDAGEAEAWIQESGLPPAVQEPLLRFVRRFPTLTFYKWPPGHSLPGTAALHAIWNALYGVHTSELRWMRFDTPGPYAHIHETPAEEIWYHVLMDTSPSSEYESVFADDHPLLFVGYWVYRGEPTYYLALKMDDEQDQQVYALNYEDIAPVDDEMGHIPTARLRPAFDSYAAMLGHIVALRLGERVIEGER